MRGKTERQTDRETDRDRESAGLVSRWGLNHKEMKGVEVRRDDDDDPRGDGSASPNGFEPQEDDPEGDDEPQGDDPQGDELKHDESTRR